MPSSYQEENALVPLPFHNASGLLMSIYLLRVHMYNVGA